MSGFVLSSKPRKIKTKKINVTVSYDQGGDEYKHLQKLSASTGTSISEIARQMIAHCMASISKGKK